MAVRKPAEDAGQAEVQARVEAEQARGYRGEVTDPEPNSTYAFPNPGERVEPAQEDTGE